MERQKRDNKEGKEIKTYSLGDREVDTVRKTGYGMRREGGEREREREREREEPRQ